MSDDKLEIKGLSDLKEKMEVVRKLTNFMVEEKIKEFKTTFDSIIKIAEMEKDKKAMADKKLSQAMERMKNNG